MLKHAKRLLAIVAGFSFVVLYLGIQRHESRDFKPPVAVFDLNDELKPIEVYDKIQCRKSAKIIVETTLCIHPVESDIYVSASIWNSGAWERSIVGKKNKVKKCPVSNIEKLTNYQR